MTSHAVHARARRRTAGVFVAFVAVFPLACGSSESEASSAPAAALIHLDELQRARIECAPVPEFARAERSWKFDTTCADWKVLSAERIAGLADVATTQLSDALKLELAPPKDGQRNMLLGGLALELPEGPRDAWSGLRVKARSSARLAGIGTACNVSDRRALPGGFAFFTGKEGTSPVFNDGSVQEYQLPLRIWSDDAAEESTLRSVALFASAPQPAAIEILELTLVPRGAAYREPHGVHSLTRDSITRTTLYAHTPAKATWSVRVPKGGRLDVALACLEGESVDYRASVRVGSGAPESVFEASANDDEHWSQRSIDLSKWSGKEIELVLEASSAAPGSVALWGAPILSGSETSSRPNVIFYVIDGGGADFMSVYGYNRRTTPYPERLAAEGVVFERAHSNSTWTQPSTASFMTSLHHSVLGGLRRGVHSTPVPASATTMSEHMRRGGYATASLTTNPNCARVIGLQRGIDMMRDVDAGNHSTSSAELHEWFWRFRADYPGHPYWVHFQTTDVHEPNEPPSPFAGLFVAPEERAKLDEWDGQMWQGAGDLFGTTSIAGFYDSALERAKIDRRAYYNVRRGLYDETMAHQDRELARFVERLKSEGEWENTLFVIGADHGHPAGTFARFGRGLIEPKPEDWQGALFDAYSTHVPLIFVWPKKIAGGRRIEQPVSMIDVLPTILDLAGLPQPEIAQGRSLAPLLLGKELAPRPVILDEFRVDEASGAMVGNLELIDGRWGASLEIGPLEADASPTGRHSIPAGGRWGAVHPFHAGASRLLLYDLWEDPFAARAVNDEHPELVEKYRKDLLEHWKVHQALATRFEAGGESALTPEVLQQLRTLGYTR